MTTSTSVKTVKYDSITYFFNPHVEDIIQATFNNNIERTAEEILCYWSFANFVDVSLSDVMEEIDTNYKLNVPRSTIIGDVMSCSIEGKTEFFMVAPVGFRKLNI